MNKSNFWRGLGAWLFLIAPLCAQTTAMPVQTAQAIDEKTAEAIAAEAYIYGYPLVTMDMTRRVMTNVASPNDLGKAPMGQFSNVKHYPDASFHDVTTPNADTLYSTAWLDLSSEPYVLHVPNEEDRYYLMPMLSGWTNVFADLGKRTTGTQAGDFAITGPDWKGTLPSGLRELKSPTNMVWILGRTYSTGMPEDYKAVHEIQSKYSLTPLSSWGKSYTPPSGKVDPSIDMKTPVRDQVNHLDAKTFFSLLVNLLKKNPPALEDAHILRKMALIGILPGQPFDTSKLRPEIVRAIENAPKLGQKAIVEHKQNAGKNINGWEVTLDTGKYGTDYLQRAYVAVFGLGANLPEDAIYPMALVDSEGNPLSGANKYVIHFDKDQIPPVNGFWSLTMYNDQLFFVNNPLNRFTLSPRNALQYNPDSSLDLYIQADSPGKDKESNWLPAPKDKFILTLRLYWPKESVLNGNWQPPAIKKVSR